MKLRHKIMLLAVLPVIILGASLYFFASEKIKEGIYEQSYTGMHATTMAIRDIFEIGNTGEYHVDENNQFWKGDTLNISAAHDIVDQIKSSTGMEVTIFYQDTRYLTTIVDDAGERQINTQALDIVKETVLIKGEDYQADNVDILGTNYIVYYIPLYQENTDTPIGMVFLGTKQSKVNDIIQEMKFDMMLINLISTIAIAIAASIIVWQMMKPLSASVASVKSIAEGNLNVRLKSKYQNRTDEVGDMCRAVNELSSKLGSIIGNIKSNSNVLLDSSHMLDKTAKEAALTIQQVDYVVQEIAAGSGQQAQSTEEAAKDVNSMGDMISETTTTLNDLNDTTDRMNSASEEVKATLAKLNRSMDKVMDVIGSISTQTIKTNDSVIRISEAANLINSIADQTNLLALNASIEAARAGEQGRGFMVVANEIKHLSEQSNKSTKEIQGILEQLTTDSNQAVELMQQVRERIGVQKDNLNKTVEAFDTVQTGIDESVDGIQCISNQAATLDTTRIKTIQMVDSLTAIAEENAAGTEEAAAAVEEVRRLVIDVEEHANSLNSIAEGLKTSIDVFQL